VRVAAASSTTEPGYAATCLTSLPIDASGSRTERVADLLDFKEIYPGSKGRAHFPALREASGIAYDRMLFFDDCGYVDNAADVARCCPGVACVRTPDGLTEAHFDRALAAFAEGKRGIL
jgi:magnesium-dependent phosphatase 1